MANFFDDGDDERTGNKRSHNAKLSNMFKDDDDDEDYWNSNSKFKSVFGDDNEEDEPDFLEEDVVNWAGDPVSTSALSAASARYRKVELPKKESPRLVLWGLSVALLVSCYILIGELRITFRCHHSH